MPLLLHRAAFWEAPDRLTRRFCEIAGACVDLSASLRLLDRSSKDYGYDSTHYGPTLSLELAADVHEWLEIEGWVPAMDPSSN